MAEEEGGGLVVLERVRGGPRAARGVSGAGHPQPCGGCDGTDDGCRTVLDEVGHRGLPTCRFSAGTMTSSCPSLMQPRIFSLTPPTWHDTQPHTDSTGGGSGGCCLCWSLPPSSWLL